MEKQGRVGSRMRLNRKEVVGYHPDAKPLSEAELDSLQWAKEFMDKYERKQLSKKLG
jgi:hypothetical protein